MLSYNKKMAMESCNICEKELSDKSKLKRHKDMVHNNKEKVKCDICGVFLQSNSLVVHKKRIHSKMRWNCDFCARHFSSNDYLKWHVMRNHEKVPWKCGICSKPFQSEKDKILHEESSHPEIKCDHCDKTFRKSSKNFRAHVKTEHMGIKHNCDLCEKSFNDDFKLRQHKSNVHSEVKAECDICGKKLSSERALISHKESVHTQIRVKCELCGKSYLKQSIYSHIARAHKGKRIPCELCGKSIKKFGMKKHVNQVHFEVRNWSCDTCLKKFGTSNQLKNHLDAVHSKLKETCEYCQKQFSKPCLKNHILKFHSCQKIVCRHCWRAFGNDSELISHIARLHQDVKCELCDKMFQKGTDKYRYHVKFGHGETPKCDECDVCGKTYQSMKALNNHIINAHSGKEWICEICDKKFADQKTLNDHIKGHLGKGRKHVNKISNILL